MTELRAAIIPPARLIRRSRPLLGAIALAGLAFAFVVPILWMTTTSFQAGEKMFQLTTEWIPSVWHPENYPNALSRAAFGRYFLNSGVVSFAVMTGNLVFCTLAGYGLAKFHFPGARLILLLILSTLMLPLEVTLVPTFLVIHKFGWLNSYQGIIGPLLVDAFGVFLMRQAIVSIPSDYLEAAWPCGWTRNHLQADAVLLRRDASARHRNEGGSSQAVDLRDGLRGRRQPQPRRVYL
jgi:multiple sugar transport system permease protein